MEIVYIDNEIVVAVKPPRVLSTDEPGGMPELVRAYLGDACADVRTVHRLDRVVSGLMVLARNAESASKLSEQIRNGDFDKTYLARVRGVTDDRGMMRDLLVRSKEERKTYVTDTPGKGVQEAILTYETVEREDGFSVVKIRIVTGRTHQIRCQFSSRGFPIVGDRKYSLYEDDCEIMLWSHSLSFRHPSSGRPMSFTMDAPWRKHPGMYGCTE